MQQRTNKTLAKSRLRPCKSQHDVTALIENHFYEINNNNNNHLQMNKLKSYPSTPQIVKQFSNRPKSSYGRSRSKCFDHDKRETSKHLNSQMRKSASVANMLFVGDGINKEDEQCLDNVKDDIDEIKSLDGESMVNTDSSDDEYLSHSPLMFFSKQRKQNSNKYSLNYNGIMLMDNGIINNNNNNSIGKKYYAFDKRFINSSGRSQRVKMMLRYNGLTEATNHAGKRNVKIYQQITVGGNSILIYDGFVNAGGIYLFIFFSYATVDTCKFNL